MDNELMKFEDVCELYKVDEDTRKVLLKRLKEIGATTEKDDNIIVNMPLFYEAIIYFNDLDCLYMKQLEYELSIVKHLKDVDNK